MAFFRSFQQNLPSVSSLVDTLSSAVEDLTAAVGEVGYALSDTVAEQVTSMMNGFRPEEESSSAAKAAATSQQEDAVLPEVSKNTNHQKTPSNLEHRANQRNSDNTSVSQRQDQGVNEERLFKHSNDRQQTLSKYQEADNAGTSLEGRVGGGGRPAVEQSARAGSACQDLGHSDRHKTTGLGISSNGRNDLKEIRYQEMKEHYLRKAEKHTKSKGSKGKEYSGNECSPREILASDRHMTQKPILKEDIHRAQSANSKDKLHGKTKEQIHSTKSYKVEGDIKTKKKEAISAKKGKGKSKDEKYYRIMPEKGEVSYRGFE